MSDLRPADRGHPLPVQRWVLRLTSAVMVWLAVWTFLALSDSDVRPLLLGAVVLGAAVTGWAASDIGALARPTDWTPEHVPTVLSAANDPRFSRLARLLAEAGDRVTVGDEVRRTLRALADERLSRLHGVDRVTEPERARVLLGDELDAYLRATASRRRLNEATHLSRLITKIEAL